MSVPYTSIEEVCLDRNHVLLDSNVFMRHERASNIPLLEYVHELIDAGFPIYITEAVREEITPTYSKKFFNPIKSKLKHEIPRAQAEYHLRKKLIRRFDEEGHVLVTEHVPYHNGRLRTFATEKNLAHTDYELLRFSLALSKQGQKTAVITYDKGIHEAARHVTGAPGLCFSYQITDGGKIMVPFYIPATKRAVG
ncbi:MAG TPA: hypothetical protein VK158_06745 [Acidobacteriota bacterium]|nr:hypothetical protein [Acidobacteriota bacterium]